jgi:hypothetical protein
MKKLLAVMLVLLIPFSVYALDKITDNVMDDVTGQSGLSLTTVGSNVTTIAIENLAWGDGDGHASDTTAGHLRVDGHITVANTMAGDLTVDVAASGIRIGMPATNSVAVTMPTSIRLSVNAGASANWAVTPTDASTVTLGNLGIQTIDVSITSPTAWIIKPH